jgi:hypothetical protein
MKAPRTSGSAIDRVMSLVALIAVVVFWVIPETTLASSSGHQTQATPALVFEVDSKAKTELVIKNQTLLTYDQIVESDPLVIKVRSFLESKSSPLAQYAEEIVKQPQWQRALAISFVESNFGKRCADNNCSGIGVRPGHPSWRKYPTKLHWFKDMAQLLEKPIYKEKYTTCAKMKGVYVVPGSSKWVNGCEKVSNELLAITDQAQNERAAIIANSGGTIAAASYELALLK